MALGSTQPLTEMSTRIFPGGKSGRCLRLTTLSPFWAFVTKSENLNFLEPSGHLGPVMELISLLHIEFISTDPDSCIGICVTSYILAFRGQ